MIILVGPSASGKTEVVKFLIKNYNYKKLVTYTSREMRINEVNGIDYNFIRKDEFIKEINEGSFFEYVEYNGNYYGTKKEDITDDKVVILEPNGLKSYINSNIKNIYSFFLDADEDVRIERMKVRQDKIESIYSRIESDKNVFNINNIEGINFIMNSNALSIEELSKEIDKLYKTLINKNEK